MGLGLINLIPRGMKRERMGLRGHITIKKNGKVVVDKRNLVVNVGLKGVAYLIGIKYDDAGPPAGEDPFDYLAVGTGAVAAAPGDTALGAEITTGGLERAQDATPALSTTSVTDDTIELNYQWTASASHAVTEAGLFNASSAGLMLARQVFTVINLASADKLEVTWKIQVS